MLDSVYELTRQEIIDVLDKLLLLPVLQFEKQSILRNFLSPAQETKLDLSDLLIAYSSKESNCSSVITFDKRGTKFEFFELLTF